MPNPTAFDTFVASFFALFTGRDFRGNDYLTYLQLPEVRRRGDEARVVDNAIVGPLLELLGFERAAQEYNQQRPNGRPDFAPRDEIFGTCFIVEDKSTALQLDFNLADPESHLSQLSGYVRDAGLQLGWLTNGQQFTVWRFDDPVHPQRIIDFDIPTAIREWTAVQPPTVSQAIQTALHDLFDLCHKDTFTSPQRLEKAIAIDLEEWQRHALPLGTGEGHENTLVDAVQSLVRELQRDARRVLEHHLTRYEEYENKASRISDDAPGRASHQLAELRGNVLTALRNSQVLLGVEQGEIDQIEGILIQLDQDARAFSGPKDFLQRVLEPINEARLRKYVNRPRAARPWTDLDDVPPFKDALQRYSDQVFAWHQRRGMLSQSYRADRLVHEDYFVWTKLVEETMLGGMDEEQRRNEFALQAAYVVFIRLLLIRVCEDKELLYRFFSDGGLKHWQEDIERYLRFANGNPYAPLLDMAYTNAQNIYAHFFTGRELFNWYQLDRRQFVLTLYQLSRFNFARVDSDIVGTIYNTYVDREEKRNKGQYYTPPVIVDYILDTVGYSGKAVIGANKRLLDPACGSGTFLVRVAKRLVDAYRNPDGSVPDAGAVLDSSSEQPIWV